MTDQDVQALSSARRDIREIEKKLRDVGTACCDFIASDLIHAQSLLRRSEEKILKEFALEGKADL